MPFPTQCPQAALERLGQELLGVATEPVAGLVEDAYDVLGYGLFLGFGSQPRTVGENIEPCAMNPETGLEQTNLPSDANALCAAPRPPVKSIPWEIILPIVLDLLKKWLSGK